MYKMYLCRPQYGNVAVIFREAWRNLDMGT
jgi:hypothetical protein